MRAAFLIALAACGTNETPQPMPAPTLPSCLPNRDGIITADELPIAYGAAANYYAGDNRSVDLTPKNGVWNLGDERPDDTIVAIGPVALHDQWYAASFPTGQFVVDAGGGLDGIYHQNDQGLFLDGTASRAMSPETLIRYAAPVAVLRFPVTDGDSFTTTAAISDGMVSGLPFVGSDKVDVEVSGSGRLDVPYVRFSPVLRIREHVVRTPSTGAPIVGKRTDIFLFECFGEVARAESKTDEPSPDFTQAAYLRRFALGVTP